MENQQIIELIRRELPGIMQRHSEIREWVLQLTQEQYADKRETESRFGRILEKLRLVREENARRWDEQNKKGWCCEIFRLPACVETSAGKRD